MPLLSRQTIEDLIANTNGPRLSLFIPTHRAGEDIQQDAIRLKNLTNQAEDELRSRGVNATQVNRLLQPLRDLLPEHGFWEHQSDGLAIFRSSDVFQLHQVPLDLEEQLAVGAHFVIKPLIPLLTGDGRFYILALSQDEVRLLIGTRSMVGKVVLDGVPKNIAEALRWDEPHAQVQWHTATAQRPRQANLRDAIFYGHGVESAGRHDEHILRFFQLVDQGVTDLLNMERAPLVLAGVEDIQSIYRQANNYQHLVESGIEGNPETWSNKELHQRAWPLVEPIFEADREEAKELCHQLLGQNDLRASADMQTIALAAYTGGIEVLFLAHGREVMGTIDEETLRVKTAAQEDEQARDLTDLLAAKTLVFGGRVYLLPPEDVPGNGLSAALLRHDMPETAAP
jgi:hypothetical protein